MFPSKTLLSLVFIALSVVDASPLSRRTGKATLSFAARLSERDLLSIPEKDRARAQSMKQTSQGLGKRDSISATNSGVHYAAQVGVGAGTYSLLIDTGSSNTFVGAGQPYQPGPNSKDTGETVSVTYGSGSWSGEEFTDDVTLGSMTIQDQSIGVASTSTGFSGVDGILGVGPTSLTVGTTSGGGKVPTVVDNLFTQGIIGARTLGVYFAPASVPAGDLLAEGELTFGGVDSSHIIGAIQYVPITQTSPASNYWGIDQSITYADGTTILSSTAGIVDTGSTLLLIATDAFNTYQSLTGATLDSTTGLLTIDATNYGNLKSLLFNIGSTSYELTPDAQTWPRSLNTAVGGNAGSIYLIVSDIGSPSGQGLDFINGYTFLERFYSIYDTDNAQVGLAATPYTYTILN